MKKRKVKYVPNIDFSKPKVIFIDNGVYLHSAIYAWEKNKKIHPTFLYLSMLLGDLKKVKVNKDDLIIIAVDKGHSWRKTVDEEYKSSRKKKRELHKDIPWERFFEDFNRLLETLESYTNFHVIESWGFEADDIIAVGSRYFKEKNVIILSFDSDLEQLFYYKNVNIFSPKSKKFKEPIKDPIKLLEKKIEKEASDDLVKPILTVEDYEKRKMIVNLLTLPPEIENTIKEKLSILPEKDFILERIPFKTIRNRIKQIFL